MAIRSTRINGSTYGMPLMTTLGLTLRLTLSTNVTPRTTAATADTRAAITPSGACDSRRAFLRRYW